MWSTFKTMPLLVKVFILLLLVGGLYQIGTMNDRKSPGPTRFTPASDDSTRYGEASDREQASQEEDASRQSHAANSNLAQFQAQQMQIQARAQQCEAQMTEATNRQAQAAMNGIMYNQRPACEQQMPQLIAQEAYVEREIQRIQNPGDNRSVQEVTGMTPYDPNSTNGYNHPDGGIPSVERYDRQAVREHTMYTDESGQQHELPTQPHYYRDRSSGQIVSFNQANPPNDGRDYEQFTPEGPQ